MVKTDSGDVAIETISEGMRILTDANFQRFGIASDEEVEVDLPEPLLVGFSKFASSSVQGFRQAS